MSNDAIDGGNRLANPATRGRKSSLRARLVAAGLMIVAGGGGARQVWAQNRITLPREQVVRQVFRGFGSMEEAKQERLQELLLKVDVIAASAAATAEQREKLELAGRGDVHRYFAEFDAFLRRHPFGSMPREAFDEMLPEMQRLSHRFRGDLHGDDSLLAKTIPQVLTPEQHDAWQKAEQELRWARYADRVAAAVILIDRRVPMTDRQRRAFIRFVLEKTQPPPEVGESGIDLLTVLIRVGSLPEDQLAEFFSDQEWRVVSDIFAHARSMEPMIRRQAGGVLPP